jgi:S-layer homology domain
MIIKSFTYAVFPHFLLFYPYLIMSNFFTKLTSVMGAATLVAVSTSASLVAAASEFLPYAETLADNSVISAQSTEAGYRLGDNVTRAEIAKVVANLGGIDPVACSGTTYSDVGSGLGDLCGYVEALADAGVVSTSSATFRPNANVTRAEMVKMILGALGEVGSDVDAGYMDLGGLGDLASYVNRANEIGCISDSSYFRPNASSSRGEAFKVAVICAGLDVSVEEPTDPTDPTSTGSTVSTGGSLSVALDGSAMAQYVPKNASSVKVGSVKLTAGSADVTVSSLVVTRSGLGNAADISSVQLTQNGVALSDARSMSTSSQSATLKLTNNMVVKAGESAVVDVLVSLSGAENNQHQFAVTTVTGLNGATVTGVPVTLGLLNTTSYTVGTVTVDSFGGTPSSVTSGKANQIFATVKLTPSGKDAVINSFTLTKGTGSEDYTKVFANVSAYFNSTKVGTVTLSTDKITVTGLNISRLSGEQASIELRADIVFVGSSGTKTSFKVDSSSDVSATEKTTGYAMMVGGYSATAQANLDLNSVDLTITKTSTGTLTVAPGASAVELYKATVTSDATFDVSNYTLSVVASSTSASGLSSFSDNKVTVYINGVDYELSNSTPGATTSTKNWTATADRFRVEPGVPVTVRVVGNLKSNAFTPADYTTTFSISELRNVSNGATSNVSKSQAGDKVTVKSGTVVLKDATQAPPSTRRIYSSADLEIGRFAVESQAENLTVRKLTVTNAVLPGSGGVSDWTTIISGNNVKLVDVATSSQVSATVTVTAGSIVFDNMSAEVSKDTTRNFKVVVTTTSFSSGEHGKSVDISVTLDTVDKSSGGSAAGAPATLASVNSTSYVTGVVPPTVAITKKSAKVFLVKVTNVDSDSTVTLESIKARVKPVAVNNSSYTAIYCLRAEGSSVSTCPEASTSTSTGSVPGGATVLTIATPPVISKSNGSYSYEILVDSNFVDPTDLLGEVLQVTYNTGTTEDYQVSAQ